MTTKLTLTPAELTINEFGTPESKEYGDVYFSNTHGIDETHYVFLGGNDIHQRWLDCSSETFCIAETGFGTGLNFFVVAQQFLTFRDNNPHHVLKHLQFISTEKHPIDKQDAQTILSQWPEFTHLVPLWFAQYPIPIQGVHRCHFGIEVTLDLHYADASEAFENLHTGELGVVDAWFLDGFAPSKNASMWQESLFNAMARVSKAQATFATFTAAGFVKRGLIEAGFTVNKRKGFRHKRDMLKGKFETRTQLSANQRFPNKHSAPYFHRHSACEPNKLDNAVITVVGNGLAGALVAYKLTQLGERVDLVWQSETPADGASAAPIGGFYPQLNAQNNHASQIQLHSFLYACSFYETLAKQAKFDHQWCGALQLAFNDKAHERLVKMQDGQFWPHQVAHKLSAAQASNVANIQIPYDALYMPKAGWISAASLVEKCIEVALESGLLTLTNQTTLHAFTPAANQQVELQLFDQKNQQHYTKTASSLVIATGFGSQALLKDIVELRTTRGQIELIKSTPTFAKLKTLLCHKGYFTPAHNGQHALGSTYIKEDADTQVRASETEQNFAMHIKSMEKADWVNELGELNQSSDQSRNSARAAVRCSSPDHLPVVGALPSPLQNAELSDLYKALPVHNYPVPSVLPNVFVLTALGSRGLTTAPLMAEILVSQLLGRPLPMHNELINTLSPNRFLVRDLIRRQ
jgi:tRNA 5-methylaminomethyl-2-thiouridine biosynthesis bifunctional protein